MIITKRKSFGMVLIMILLFTMVTPGFSVMAVSGDTDSEPRNGLKGEFYTNSSPGNFDFAEKKATVVSPNINFGDLNALLNQLTEQENDATVRWTGQIKPEFTEDYTFSMIGDNGFRLWIDDQLIIDHWVNDWDIEQTSTPISLEAGELYDIKVEYFEDMGGAHLKMRWESPSQQKEIVPSDRLYLPEGYTHVGPLASSISEDGKMVEVTFENALEELPADTIEHFTGVGNSMPTSISLKEGDASTIVIELDYPITSKDNTTLPLTYDGEAEINTTNDTKIEEFTVFSQNNSTYLIASPWAEEVDEDNVLPEYPRPQLVRNQWLNLNGKWEFESASEADSLPTGKTLEEDILVPFAVESKLSGVERQEDHMWYKRNFTIPADWSGDDILLHFGAVDWETNVYVNGSEVGSHKGGFDEFSFNISDYLVPGDNELIVEVKDETNTDLALGKQRLNPGGIFYTSVSGIWQTVWLEPVAEAHISDMKMTPEINDEYLGLVVEASGNSAETVEAVAYKDGQEVGRVTGAVGEDLQLSTPDPRLWSTTDPFLYDLEVYLKNGDTIVDEVSSYFGMREISTGMVDGKLRPLLNGEFVFQMGPLDQGYWPAGLFTAPTDDALKFDIEQAKDLGFNMIRKHAKVEPQRFHYWADKMGMLVWQDMPQMFDTTPTQENAAQFEHEFEEIIDEHYNSPSLILWTVFNEGWGQYDTVRITNRIKELDPTRLVSNASGWTDMNVGDLIDFHAYVGPDSPTPTDDRIAVLGEYGGLGLQVPGHEWSSNVFNYEMQSSKEELTKRYLGLIDGIKQLKEEPGLSAAVYTQITDVEIEINGLLSYDRKVEKADFDQLRKAHRELIGIVDTSDLVNVIEEAQQAIDDAEVGPAPGQYAQGVVDALTTAIAGAQAVVNNSDVTKDQLLAAIKALEESVSTFKDQINAPIAEGAIVDHFDSDVLADRWSIYRENDQKWNLTDVPGKLRIRTSEGDSHEGANTLKNLFLTTPPSEDFEITTKLTAPIRANHQQAGLYIWEDEDNYVRLGHVWDTSTTNGYSIETAKEENGSYSKPSNMVAHPETDTMYLKMKKKGNQVTTYYWNGNEWVQASDPVTVSLENIKVGLYGTSTFAGDINADFDYFTVQPLIDDVTELEDLIETAEAISNSEGAYTETSFTALQGAIAEAKSTLSTIETEAALTKAIAALQAAVDGLETNDSVIDVMPLEDLIDVAKAISNGDSKYTEASFQALQAAISSAEEALTEVETDEEVTKEVEALQAAIDGLVETPDTEDPGTDPGTEDPGDEKPTSITTDGKSVAVSASKEYTIEGTNAKVKMPADLPEGTTVQVRKVTPDTTNKGLKVAGDVLEFIFEYPTGASAPTGSFTLVLGYDNDADASRVAIYYYNEATGDWEYKGGDVNEENQTITLEVPHFSTYGVFVEDEGEQEQPGQPDHDKGDELPDTATPMYTYLLIGFVLLVLGTTTFFFIRRRNENV
ncbi:PA14 domain-containing protein [Radiobacillus sp. PE A8.2]|uniref:PA14 domain-containing protein n=1 Tax=Radiobacillus sp. PE A8.2 TaxID=3380349 RepID=UPI00388FE6AB